MHLKVELRPCAYGHGLFALERILPGELIFFVNGPLVNYQQGLGLPCGGDHSVQIGPDLYVDPQFPSKFINHSCDPNAGIRDDLAVVALRAIAPEEQVAFDYSTCILERSFRMKCLCGAAICRGEIGDFDELPETLQKNYILQGVVQPFIMDHYFGRRRELSAFEKEFQNGPRLAGRRRLPGQPAPLPDSPRTTPNPMARNELGRLV